jgi:hypothetical protein
MYQAQNGWRLVTVDTLYVDIKDMIEQKFPRLDQDIIDDALAYGRHQYTEVPLAYSDKQAENFFLNSVMERIHQRIDERIKSEYDKLIELMLVRERNPRTPLRSNIAQDFTSGFISLPSRPIEMIAEKIAEENRNKLIPQHLQFPIVRYQLTSSETPSFFYHDNKGVKTKQFWSLNYKLKNQIIYMAKINKHWKTHLLMKMFDEIYRLAQLNLNANVLERLIIDSVMRILNESSVPEDEMINFIQLFENTINNQENRRYCRIYQENLRRNSLRSLSRV